MKKFLAAIMIVILLFTVCIPKETASADALVISQLAAAAYAIGTSSGLNFAFTAGTGAGAQTYMENRLSTWVGNQSGGMSIFGSTPVRAIAGKLAITQTAFNALKNFITDYVTENSVGETETQVSAGMVGGVFLDTDILSWGLKTTGFSATKQTAENAVESSVLQGYYRRPTGSGNAGYAWRYYIYYNGTEVATFTSVAGSDRWVLPIKWQVHKAGNNLYSFKFITYETTNDSQAPTLTTRNTAQKTINGTELTDVIKVSLGAGGIDFPDVLEGDLQTYKRQDWAPDTNLEDMLEDIFDDVSQGDLDLTDETVEDQPTVTPQPTAEPGIDTNIGELVGDIAGTLEGVQEGVGEITEALEGVGEDVGSIAEALDVPTTAEATQLKLPDLRTLFPFCIPFDIYNIITAFNATPVAPHIQIPFNIPAIGLTYTFDLDFSGYNSVAVVLRTLEFVAYAVGLAILTSKVIRW